MRPASLYKDAGRLIFASDIEAGHSISISHAPDTHCWLNYLTSHVLISSFGNFFCASASSITLRLVRPFIMPGCISWWME